MHKVFYEIVLISKLSKKFLKKIVKFLSAFFKKTGVSKGGERDFTGKSLNCILFAQTLVNPTAQLCTVLFAVALGIFHKLVYNRFAFYSSIVYFYGISGIIFVKKL